MDDRRGVGGRVEKMKDLRNTDWEFQSCHGDVRYSTGNIVNNTEITRYGARWVLEISGGPLRKVRDCPTTMLYT